MTISTNCNARFCDNQFIDSILSYSSQLTAAPASNVYDPKRSRVWKPTGYFKIDSTNNKIYVGALTGTIASGDYTTPTNLTYAIQAALNAVDSNWTVTYSATTLKFTIANTGSKTLKKSIRTDSIWDDIGFTGLIDQTGTSFDADLNVNHMYEYLIFDMGQSTQIDFFGSVGPIDEVYNFSASATVKIQANTINNWSAPPLDITLTKSDYGLFRFFDDVNSTYRYWRFYFEDPQNQDGPSGFNVGHIYLGTYTTLTSNNITNGFNFNIKDPSDVYVSEKGVNYFDKKPKYFIYDNLEMVNLEKTDQRTLERMFQQLGKSTPLYLSLDPTLAVSDNMYEMTKFVLFNEEPKFRHIIARKYSISMSFKEAV